MSRIGSKVKKEICVISYPDYKDTEIYMKAIEQLKDLDHSFTVSQKLYTMPDEYTNQG